MAPVPRWQSVVFLVATAVACAAALLGVRLGAHTELMVAAGLIGLVGLPHGAIDPLLAARVYRFSRPAEWAVFAACYAGLALGVGIAPAGVPLNILTLSLVQGIADSGAPDIEEADGGAAVLDGFADVPFRMSHWRDLELALFFNRLGERPVEDRTIVIYGTVLPSAR